MKAKLSQFNYDLPKKLIAKYPADERDESRLMVVHRDSGKIEHKMFKDVIDYFDEDDCFIMNNTKVFPARLFGCKEKTGANIEVFLLRELNEDAKLWDVLVDPARKIRVGNKLYFSNPNGEEKLVAEVIDNTTSRGRTIRFYFEDSNEEFKEILFKLGNTPLPKYINIGSYGNTSAATIAVALTEALEEGRVSPGDVIVFAAFGAGLSWAAAVLRWGDRVTPLGTSDADLPPTDKDAFALLEPNLEYYGRPELPRDE